MDASSLSDRKIRTALRTWILSGDPAAVIVDEMSICRAGRADLAAINGNLAGYEIKGCADTLRRLPGQITKYDRIFDFATVVVTERHRRSVKVLLPPHWGIILASEAANGCKLAIVRKPRLNSDVHPLELVRLLWKTELINSLRSRGIAFDRRSSRLPDLWDTLATEVPIAELADDIRKTLSARFSGSGRPQNANGG